MKNIHLLPTDKPSRLYTNHGQLHLDSIFQQSNGHTINQNVYITSDLEIKDGWILNTYTNEIYFLKGFYGIQPITKKIILTTDPDLIKDGVQAIDDEFLEWFVKNPSCEFVEWDKNYNRGNGKYYYKIIIPQEESKTGYSKSETEFLGIEFTLKDGSKQFVPKQETLEEAADNWVRKPVIGTKRESFIAGANWQAERMYTYDEMRTIAYNAYCFGQLDSPTEGKFNLWIQKSKKI
jgi:hypothetical protein